MPMETLTQRKCDRLRHIGISADISSQSDAVIEAMTREMSLIQGPPGTGKVNDTSAIVSIVLNQIDFHRG